MFITATTIMDYTVFALCCTTTYDKCNNAYYPISELYIFALETNCTTTAIAPVTSIFLTASVTDVLCSDSFACNEFSLPYNSRLAYVNKQTSSCYSELHVKLHRV